MSTIFATSTAVVLLGLTLLVDIGNGQYNRCDSSYFNNVSGTIKSPNYPRNYPNNYNCSYTVSSPSSYPQNRNVISFTIRDLALETTSDCNYDWVQLSCVSPSSGVGRSQRYCGSGNNLAPVVFYPCTQAVVWFRTDTSVVSSGFQIDYRVTSFADCGSSCASNITRNSCPGGCSFNFRYGYCTCQMTSSQTTAATTCPPGCRYDYDFYGRRVCQCSGLTTATQCPYGCSRRTNSRGQTYCDCSPSATSSPCPYGCYYDTDWYGYRYCNCPNSTPPPIWCSPGCTSDVNMYGERYCRCVTTAAGCYSPCYDRYDSYYGRSYCYCPPTTTNRQPAPGCGMTRTSSYGIVTSPNYPYSYPNGDCTQHISIPGATEIKITLLDVDLYYRNVYSCVYGYVEITGCDNMVINFCSTSTLSSSTLTFRCSWYSTVTAIKFHSTMTDYSRTYRGFKMSYIAKSSQSCNYPGGYLTEGSTGVVTSPGYPSSFPDYSECSSYLFTDRNDLQIQLWFDELRLDSYSNCQTASIVFSCRDYSPPVNSTVCGSEHSSSMTFTCKNLLIYFRAGYASHYYTPRNFKLRYTVTNPYSEHVPHGETERPFTAYALGMTLGVGVGGLLLVVLVVMVIVITVRYRRQMVRLEQRHLEELTVVCRNTRSDTEGSVAFSRSGGCSGGPNGGSYDLLSSDPPAYTYDGPYAVTGNDEVTEEGGAGEDGVGRGPEGRGPEGRGPEGRGPEGSVESPIQLNFDSDESLLLL